MELTSNAILVAFPCLVKGKTRKTSLLLLNKGNEHIMYLTVIPRYYHKNA